MYTVQQVILIDSDMEGNLRKEHKLGQVQFASNIKISVNAGIALMYLRQQNDSLEGKPRLIILNVNTPIMDGYEFLSELRNSRTICTKNLMIAVIKDGLTSQQIDKLRIMGVTNFIEDNFCPESLTNIIKHQIAKPFSQKSQLPSKGGIANGNGLQVFAA
ncbi:MAG: hypothetical protein EAZ07_08645 [Cytophagales bacterium]|nr:MAG: hypothetical protein EAZ07_08645 [Cytophagales bacterium]